MGLSGRHGPGGSVATVADQSDTKRLLGR
jgi:hypothetical protein